MSDRKYSTLLQALLWVLLFLLIVLQLYGFTLLRQEISLRNHAELTLSFVASLICSAIMVSILWVKSENFGEMQKSAYVDVTGVHNKRACMEKLQQLDQQDDTLGIGIAMFDLNDLKKINDDYGHDKGDALIEAFAQLLCSLLTNHGFLARFGGDEFILIQEKSSDAQIHQMISALQQSTQAYNQNHAIPIAFASGFAVSSRKQYWGISDLLKEADKRMYENKRESKKNSCMQWQLQARTQSVDAENICLCPVNPVHGRTERKDTVTGLLTMETFLAQTEKILHTARPDAVIAVICMDISNFHDINESLGYQHGNQALQLLADALKKEAFVQCASRIHSDVFAFLIVTTEKSIATVLCWLQANNRAILRKMRQQFCNQNFKIHTGVYFAENWQENPEHFLNHANVARKLSKSQGGSIEVYSDAMDRQEKKRAAILRDFRSAIQQNEIKLYLQPQVDAKTEQIYGAEALSRWITADGTAWLPNEFIPVLEHSGDIVLLDYFIYRQVFEWLAHRRDCRKPLITISMNISRIHLSDVPTFISYIQSLQQQYAIPSQHLVFEVTESAYIEHVERVAQLIDGLQTLGIRTAMDDFGSGYSSLKALKLLPFDEIKIDKSFLENGLCKNEQCILQAVLQLLKQLQKTVVCEGVETKEEVHFLQEKGCDILQGFFYSTAITTAHLEEQLDILPFTQKRSS